MADKNQNNEQTNAPVTEQTTEQANEPATEKKKLDKRAIIAIAVAIIGFLAILFGILAACGVFNKNTPEDQTAKITITIEVNGGTGNYEDITFVLDENNAYTFTDEEKAAITEALNRDGYELKGLSTTPDGEGGWTIIIPEDAESPLKIYAIWEKKEEPLPPVEKYTITFDMHGHGTAPANITDATALPAELPTVADDGDWIFAGWYLDGEYETAATAGATITTDTTLHAKWEAIFTHEDGVITGLTEYGKTLSTITIPGTLDGEEITGIGSNAFKNNETVTSVTIPNSVTSIGTGAFLYCKSLTNIKIPDGITSITHDVFGQCSSLTSIEIPSSLTSVGIGAFYGCTLTAVYFNGTSDEWNVYIDNSAVSNGNFTTEIVYYYSEKEPTVEGKFWHYVNNVPTVWVVDLPVEKYTITFDMHGHGTAPEDIAEATALPAELPTVEDDGDWYLAGWYLDGAYETEATAGETITTNTTLHAKWESKIFTHGNGAITGLTDYGKTLSAITIPSVIAGEEITSIGYAAFGHCENLTNVVIPNSITSIGEAAFNSCTSLTSIEIPSSVTSIGYNAFTNCTGLTSVTIPNSVTSLQGSTFRDCTSLESITIPNSVESLGHYTFMDCTGLISVIIPSGLTSIGYGTFEGCTGLTTVYYGGADSAAWDNIEIDGFNVPLTAATRYYYSEEPEVNADGTDLDGNYWHYVGGVPTIWTYADRVLRYSGNTVNGLTDYGKTLTSITIPSTINGEQITSIREQAFTYCANLTNVTLSNGITSIGSSAFTMCHGLTSVTIPNSVTSIGQSVFAYCENLTTVALPDGITSVPYLSFGYCTGLESVIIPSSVTSIGSSAFGMIDSITIYFKGTSAEWDDIEINGNTALTNGTIYYYSKTQPTEAGNYWHYVNNAPTVWVVVPAEDVFTHEGGVITGLTEYGESLTSITIPSTIDGEQITSIGDWAFTHCFFESITISGNVISIGEGAFVECTRLTSVEICAGVKSIGMDAFLGCYDLTTVTIAEGLESIGYDAFGSCTSLESITIPSSVTSISVGVLQNCLNLASIIIDEDNANYTSRNSAGVECNVIVEIATNELIQGCKNSTIPEGVTRICYEAFASCKNLESIIIPSSVTSIASRAFNDCTALTTVYYEGTSEDWASISINSMMNTALTNATRYYYSVNPPETEGNYWHYVGGVPTQW